MSYLHPPEENTGNILGFFSIIVFSKTELNLGREVVA